MCSICSEYGNTVFNSLELEVIQVIQSLTSDVTNNPIFLLIENAAQSIRKLIEDHYSIPYIDLSLPMGKVPRNKRNNASGAFARCRRQALYNIKKMA